MIYLLIIVIIVSVDLYSKCIIKNKLPVGERKSIVNDVLELRHCKNTGFSYSVHSGHVNTVAAVASAIVVATTSYLISILHKKGNKALKLGLAFSIGGALGNLYERIFKKGVTDFIYIKKIKKSPIFNIADIFILFGSVIMFFVSFSKRRI